jgi:hypothetical protein
MRPYFKNKLKAKGLDRLMIFLLQGRERKLRYRKTHFDI